MNSASAGRRWEAALWVLLAAAVARLWLVPLTSSFWIDEIGTAFVVRYGGDHWSFQIAPQVPTSIYYWFAKMSSALLGQSEAAFRLPSIVFMGVAVALVTRLAARLIHPDAGWFAAFACLALRGINYHAADARPYALGTMLVAAGFFFLVRWLDSGKWMDAAVFLACGSLLLWVHLTLWPSYIAFGLYALARQWRGNTAVGWTKVMGLFIVLALAIVPAVVFALSLFKQAASHVIVQLPVLRDLRRSLRLGYIAGCGAGALLIALALRHKFRETVRPRWLAGGSTALILIWWLCQPVSIFAFSHLTGHSLYLARYLDVALPGIALMATAATSIFLPARFWRPIAFLFGLGALYFFGQWKELWFRHDFSDWRSAAQLIRQNTPAGGDPIFCPSPFVEAQPPEWRPGYPLPSFLYSHLEYYPLPGRTYLLPFVYSPQAGAYVEGLLRGEVAGKGRFFIYGGDRNARFWWNWFASRPELRGWSLRRLGLFGNIEVILAERTAFHAQTR